MPGRNEIYGKIKRGRSNLQDEIRRDYISRLSEYTDRDTIIFSSAFTSYKSQDIPEALLSITQQDIQGFMSALQSMERSSLDLILHSPGGSLEASEQIVNYLRQKYSNIRAIIPQNAMSAATMISCAADEIIMGKHSAIGPIDPQVIFSTPQGQFAAPAQSILDEFEQAKEEINEDEETAVLWLRRMDKYPQGFLKMCENTIDVAKERVCDWLSKWMFDGTEKKGDKAEEIAEWLGDANRHKTHKRPINIEKARKIGLDVQTLESDQELQELVLSLFHASTATHDVSNCVKFIENQKGKGYFLNAQEK